MSVRRTHYTMRGIARSACPTILGLLAAITLCACQSPPKIVEKNISPDSSPPSQAAAAVSVEDQTTVKPPADAKPAGRRADADTDRASRRADDAVEKARTEPSVPDVTPPPPLKRVDPGAAYLARAVHNRLDAHEPTLAAADREAPIIIDLASIRNQSRARHDEFKSFLARFAELLSAAGESQNLLFIADPGADADYRLFGTAYLLSADGFDWWELFLNLRPVDETTTMWRCEHPVRVMRHHRPEHQQVYLAPLPRIRH